MLISKMGTGYAGAAVCRAGRGQPRSFQALLRHQLVDGQENRLRPGTRVSNRQRIENSGHQMLQAVGTGQRLDQIEYHIRIGCSYRGRQHSRLSVQGRTSV